MIIKKQKIKTTLKLIHLPPPATPTNTETDTHTLHTKPTSKGLLFNFLIYNFSFIVCYFLLQVTIFSPYGTNYFLLIFWLYVYWSVGY